MKGKRARLDTPEGILREESNVYETDASLLDKDDSGVQVTSHAR
jgi:hypothetical protein